MGRNLKSELLDLSGGLLLCISDVILYSVYLFGNSIGKSASSRGVYRAFTDADKDFQKLNTRKIIQGLKRLNYRQKYINAGENIRGKRLVLTAAGQTHLRKRIPVYKTSRNWDGKFYLVSFDIPENRKKDRDALRLCLKTVGAGFLQNSLWFTPYNPKKIVSSFYKNTQDNFKIIMITSDKESIYPYAKRGTAQLIEDIYHLSTLNDRYAAFIKSTRLNSPLMSAFKYLNILKDDPQLPFELEPEGYRAEEAHEIYLQLSRNSTYLTYGRMIKR